MNSGRKTLVSVGVGILFIIITLIYLYSEGAFQKKKDPNITYHENREKVRIPLVKTQATESLEEDEIRSFTGFVKEGRSAKLAFRVPGHIQKMSVTIGKQVKKGEFLAQLDQRDYILTVEQVKASLTEAQAVLAAMKSGAREEDKASLKSALDAAQSQLDAASANYERFKNLFSSGSASQAQLDAVKATYDSARASRDSAQQQLHKSNTARSEEITAVEAKIKGLQTQLQITENKLHDTTLCAPYDGYVSQKYVDAEEVVAPGIPVLAFTDTRTLNVEASIPETILVRQKYITGYTCNFEMYPGKIFSAELKEMGKALQSGKQAYPLEVIMELPEGVILYPGMAATVNVSLKREGTGCVIPLSALCSPCISDGEKNRGSVWTVDKDNVAQQRDVTVYRIRGDSVEIISGLQPGEIIITAGARFLIPGQRVRLK